MKDVMMLRVSSAVMALCWGAGASAQNTTASKAPEAATVDNAQGDIVVTARQRSETLVNVPVAVTAVSGSTLIKSNAIDLSKIAELAPGVIVSNYRATGGGSIAIRGISSPGNALGFEQAVSVSIDGVQTSNGQLASLGFFDVRQVEILKGPQALLFGKNSPAGVISISSNQPTSRFEAALRTSYEFVADEAIVDGVISGPISNTFGARLAVRGRTMKGWLYNDARPIADNPFIAGADSGLRGAVNPRSREDEILARLTLAYDPSSAAAFNLKIAYDRDRNDGAGAATQNIGPCPTGLPKVFGVADPNGDCKVDNHLTNGDPTLGFATSTPGAPTDGKSFGSLDAWAPVLTGNFDLGFGKLTSITGYTSYNFESYYGNDQSSYSEVALYETQKYKAFSQEARLLTNFKGPFNIMAGGYYQRQTLSVYNAVKLNDAFYNPSTGKYSSWEKHGEVTGNTVSFFGQGLLTLGNVEIAGGARLTRERKSLSEANDYGFPATTYPTGKALSGSLKNDNVSPEATISWHPIGRTTLYVAYRTGYKSGGYNLTSPITAATTVSAIDFGPEKVKGFEVGAKGTLLDGKLFLALNAYDYKYADLQVNAYDAASVSYTVLNAASVRQKGIEFQATYRPVSAFEFRSAVSYNHNRFGQFVGQCYGYSYAAGDVTSPAPANCRFRSGTRILEQDFTGRAPARSPDWSGNAGATYRADLGAVKLELFADSFYTGSYYASETMASSTFQRAFWRVNAGFTVSTPDDRWRLGLNGRNLTNKYYLLFAADRTGGTSVPLTVGEQRGVVARGREVSLNLGYKF